MAATRENDDLPREAATRRDVLRREQPSTGVAGPYAGRK